MTNAALPRLADLTPAQRRVVLALIRGDEAARAVKVDRSARNDVPAGQTAGQS